MSDTSLIVNGVDGDSGGYLLGGLSAPEVAAAARGERAPAAWHLRVLRWWHELTSQAHLGPMEGVDPRDLGEAGWGVIFAHDVDPAIREALEPLLAHRRAQASRRDERCYRELVFRPGESKRQFLPRLGAALGNPADPGKVPYYLLIAGSPTEIPFRFQYQLDVEYAVGRIDFDRPEDYARYAESVVEAETAGARPAPGTGHRAAFFGVKNPDDLATRLSHDHLVRPLARWLDAEREDWSVEAVLGEEATKARLLGLLGGGETPSLLFTASHGVGFRNGSRRQLPCQGALLCQDWPGPRSWRKPVPQNFYVAGDDVASDARLGGLICFHFACYGGGTPELDYFAQRTGRDRGPIAPHDFVARLPRRLLGHPGGGALAVLGHVERSWSYSFLWPRAGEQLQAYQGVLKRLLDGHPVGSAMEVLNQRYAALSTDLADELEEIRHGKTADDPGLAGLWTARNDARSFVVLGDPAVRLAGHEG